VAAVGALCALSLLLLFHGWTWISRRSAAEAEGQSLIQLCCRSVAALRCGWLAGRVEPADRARCHAPIRVRWLWLVRRKHVQSSLRRAHARR